MRIMMITCRFISLLLLLSAGAMAQENLSINVKNEPLEKVFAQIEKQTNYTFFYDVEIFKNSKNVTANIKNVTLEQELTILLKNQSLDFKISNHTISIVKKKEPTPLVTNTYTPENIVNIRGRVTDSLGNPLVGASVLVKGSSSGTTTDSKGNFIIPFTEANEVLVISYTGYGTKQILIKDDRAQNITLDKIFNPLDEIQVIAYGSTTKRMNTGDQTTVTSKEIEQQPVANVLVALEGRVPGVDVIQATGLPGTAVSIQIRGQNSIANGYTPLYVIDGVPYTTGNISGVTAAMILGTNQTDRIFSAGSPFSFINPSDIESVDILKDADATAIYGTRGANGVVLITTKKGKAGQTRVDINVQNGWGKVADHLKLLNTQQYLEMRHEAFNNDGATPNPNADYDLTLWDTTRYTDWQKTLLGGTAGFTTAQATVSGGNSNTQFLVAAGYSRQSTVFPGDFEDQKGSVNFNINNLSPNRKFSLQLTGIFNYDNNRLPGFDLTQQALQLAPDAPALYNADGSINWAINSSGVSTWPNYSPAATRLSLFNMSNTNLVSNAIIGYKILPDLQISSSFGYTNTQTNELNTVPLAYFPPSARSSSQRQASFGDISNNSWIIEPQINYGLNISRGRLTALAGATLEHINSDMQTFNAAGFPSDLVLQDLSAATSIVSYTTISVYKYASVFGRMTYNWQNKYILNLVGRRDGSSRFGPANEYHNFWSAGGAWIFSKEDFIQKTLPFLSFGKIRGSYGTTGSDQIGDYTFLDRYQPLALGVLYQNTVGYYPTNIFTPNLSWEETKKGELGIELGALKDRIFFSASYYQNRSSDQLLGYVLPTITGFNSVTQNLPATVENKGWEFELKTVNIQTANFQWTTAFNISLNRNKLISGAPGLSEYYAKNIGYPLSVSWAYHFMGVNPFNGLYQFAGGDGKATNTPDTLNTPLDYTKKYFGGLSNTFSYKGLVLDVFFQFTGTPFNNYLYYGVPGSFNASFGGNQPVDVLSRWRQPGDVSNFQKFSQNGSTESSYNYAQQSDQRYSVGYFIRLKNVSLSWQLPRTWLNKCRLQSVRLYAQGQNLLTFTDYKGLDPESVPNSLPPLRVITFGFQLTL